MKSGEVGESSLLQGSLSVTVSYELWQWLSWPLWHLWLWFAAPSPITSELRCAWRGCKTAIFPFPLLLTFKKEFKKPSAAQNSVQPLWVQVKPDTPQGMVPGILYPPRPTLAMLLSKSLSVFSPLWKIQLLERAPEAATGEFLLWLLPRL